ncbi:MAG: Xaa-Pro peptidase family protein [Flavobacteriaceae bacterium]|nr:Xaa-Pro peptidase family protein [Flavobacteriaceae bacterium]
MNIPKSEFKQRMETLQQNVMKYKLDAFVVSEEESIYYLTGLTYKSLERLFVLVVKSDKVTFIVPKMELAHLKHVKNVDELKYYWEYPAKEGERWEDILIDEIKKCKTIGVENKTPFEIYALLKSVTFQIQECSLLNQQRWIKSSNEIELIKIASKYCETAIHQLNANCYYGMTELEILGIGKNIQRSIIAETDFDYLASSILVAAWPSRISFQPHGIPKVDDKLIEGSHISLAFLRVNGYAAELERTFFTKKPTNEQKNIFRIMLEARKKCYKILREGIPSEEVDLASKHFLEKEGLGNNIMHRTGHGIGLGNHEEPFLAEGDKTILKENMVVSIEPGIYIEGIGGFRHSDTVRITKNGFEVLTNCVDEIEDLTFENFNLISRIKGVIAKKMFKIK